MTEPLQKKRWADQSQKKTGSVVHIGRHRVTLPNTSRAGRHTGKREKARQERGDRTRNDLRLYNMPQPRAAGK